MIEKLLLIGAGGAIGAMLRFLVVQSAGHLTGETAWGTLFVNVVGSFLMGVLAIYVVHHLGDGGARLGAFAMTGVLGGFTTFSAYSLDAFRMWDTGNWVAAVVYASATVLLSLGAVGIGVLVARAAVE